MHDSAYKGMIGKDGDVSLHLLILRDIFNAKTNKFNQNKLANYLLIL